MAGSDWDRFVSEYCYTPDLGLALDPSHLHMDAAARDSLRPAFELGLAAMRELEAGAIANPDEQRMVGHYWLRAPELAPEPAIRTAIEQTRGAVLEFAGDVLGGTLAPPGAAAFTDLLAIGIGGSALGPQFLSAALEGPHPPLRAHFIDNTDPDGIDRAVAGLGKRLTSTLVVVTSKSGSTPETRNGMLEVAAAFDRAGLSFSRQAVAITGEGSLLDQQAQEQGWLARFPMWDWVGGRTSVLSAVGLLPAALQAIDVSAMLEGARRMDEATRAQDQDANPAVQLARAWHVAGAGRGARDMVILPYKDSLLLFSRYLQQLIMESLGKGRDLDGQEVEQGIAVYGNKGSTDQHAYVQQLREGLNNFFVTFIEVLEVRSGPSIEVEPGVTSGDYLSGLLHGTRTALRDNGRPSLTITIPRVDAQQVGALIALYERAVGLYASVVNINAYHQPGVEAGKRAAAQQLALQKRVVDALAGSATPQTVAELAAAAGVAGEEYAVFHLLRHLAANGRGVRLSGDPGRPDRLRAARD